MGDVTHQQGPGLHAGQRVDVDVVEPALRSLLFIGRIRFVPDVLVQRRHGKIGNRAVQIHDHWACHGARR